MRFVHVMPVSDSVEELRQLVISEHRRAGPPGRWRRASAASADGHSSRASGRLGGSQGLKLYLGETTAEQALIKPEDYAQPLSSLR